MPNPPPESLEELGSFVGLICKRCGGISDGPIDERTGVCACKDEGEFHYEPTALVRLSDVAGVLAYTRRADDEASNDLADQLREIAKKHTKWEAGALRLAANELDRLRETGGCEKPDACEWEWWPDHCQCASNKGKRQDAPEPPLMRERNAPSRRAEQNRKRILELEDQLTRPVALLRRAEKAEAALNLTQQPVQQGQEGRLREGQVAVELSLAEAYAAKRLLWSHGKSESEAVCGAYGALTAALIRHPDYDQTALHTAEDAALQDSEERCERCGGSGTITKTASPRFTQPAGLSCEVPCPNCSRDTGRGG